MPPRNNFDSDVEDDDISIGSADDFASDDDGPGPSRGGRGIGGGLGSKKSRGKGKGKEKAGDVSSLHRRLADHSCLPLHTSPILRVNAAALVL